MDMYQKRKMRQEKKNSSKNNGVEKIQLNWYIPTLINFLRKAYFTRVHI